MLQVFEDALRTLALNIQESEWVCPALIEFFDATVAILALLNGRL